MHINKWFEFFILLKISLRSTENSSIIKICLIDNSSNASIVAGVATETGTGDCIFKELSWIESSIKLNNSVLPSPLSFPIKQVYLLII